PPPLTAELRSIAQSRRPTGPAARRLSAYPAPFATLRSYIMHASPHGRPADGQNLLHDRTTHKSILENAKTTTGPIIAIGPGAGALTKHLVHLERPVRAVEIDRRLAESLAQRVGKKVEVVHDDFLHYRLPHIPHVLVGNLPFHLTTAILR